MLCKNFICHSGLGYIILIKFVCLIVSMTNLIKAMASSLYNISHFQLLDVFTSPQSVVLYYKINRGLLASEVMILDDSMKAVKVFANYDKDDVG